jgi:hypothetical protein
MPPNPRRDDARIEAILASALAFNQSESANQVVQSNPDLGERLRSVMKTRHLSKSERDVLHSPLSDVCETSKGDVLKNASTLQVQDLVDKYT